MSSHPHPTDPEPFSPDAEPAVGNPTQLPIEPEFGQKVEPVEPEDPANKPVAPQ